MEAPKCKICGEKHWGSVCTAFQSNTRSVMELAALVEKPMRKKRLASKSAPSVVPERLIPATEESEAKVTSNIIAPIAEQMSPKQKRSPKGTFDRKAYQRELMRKRRSKKSPSQT